MKHLLVLLILLFVNQVTFSQSKMKFKVAYAELYATYDFLSKLSDSYPDNALKSEFSKSRYNTETCRKMIRQLDTLKLDYTYYFEQYPPTLKNAFSSRSQFEKNLIDSQTITEFKTKSFGVVPNNELTDLSNIIETFVPIYNELIYQPNKPAFKPRYPASIAR